MTVRQKDRSGSQKRRVKAKARHPRALRAHPAFAPILGVWGALLGGLVVLVLPLTMIDEALVGTGLAGAGALAQWLLAAIAALVMGGGLYMAAAKLSVKAQARGDSRELVRAVHSFLRPIDPVNDLGSPSFDAPLADMPFPARPAAPAEASDEKAQPSVVASAEAPRELDLAQFAELPGRNAVWVEEPVAEPRHKPVTQEVPAPPTPKPVPAPAPVPPSASALDRLRAVPPEALSTVQMVERFAAALQEHRDPTTGKASHHRVAAPREAALAEALKALATLSKQDSSPDTREPLRDAIAQFQPRRGAA
jgi:hypothetical protein